MSIEAMAHALSTDPGQSTRKLVLIGVANHAHKDGRNSWASTKTLGEYANCDARTVRRHLGWLLENGFLREGDQSANAHLRDRRPTVYDVAMSEVDRLTWKDNYVPGARAAHADVSGPKGMKQHEDARGRMDQHEGGEREDNLSSRGDREREDTGVEREDTWTPTGGHLDPLREDTAMSSEPSLNRPEPSKNQNLAAQPAADGQDAVVEAVLAGAAAKPVDGGQAVDAKGVTSGQSSESIDEEAKLRSLAHDLQRRWFEVYEAQHAPIVGTPRQMTSKAIGVRDKVILPALQEGYTETEIATAFLIVGDVWPTEGPWQRALGEARRGKRFGKRWDGPKRTNLHHDDNPDDARHARIAQAWADGPREAVG
jgi:hypothetical protein